MDSDINNLIMDYLVTEGYPSAAQKFAAEANIQPRADFESITERVEIRESIHRGDLQTAIEKINELNPQVRAPSRSEVRPTASTLL
jgi:glucose-induced degradation protein 8